MSAPRRPFVLAHHVPRRHSLRRRAVLPQRYRLWRRAKGPKITLKFSRVQTLFFSKKDQNAKKFGSCTQVVDRSAQSRGPSAPPQRAPPDNTPLVIGVVQISANKHLAPSLAWILAPSALLRSDLTDF
jgi:hypothetical protein